MSGPVPIAPPGPEEVHVWWISLEPALADARAMLAPDERARANQFRRAVDREHWVSARAALRLILSGYTGIPPDRLRFAGTSSHAAQGSHDPWEIPPTPIATGEGGRGIRADRWVKPALAGSSPLRFSLTHAGDRAALAVAWAREVGIDLEPIDPALNLPPLLAVACTPAESALIEALPAAERVASFLTLWTLKEAYLKAQGSGLSRDPRTIAIELLAEERAAVDDPHCESEPQRWRLCRLHAGPGWVAALAIGGAESVVKEFHWSPRLEPRRQGAGHSW